MDTDTYACLRSLRDVMDTRKADKRALEKAVVMLIYIVYGQSNRELGSLSTVGYS